MPWSCGEDEEAA